MKTMNTRRLRILCAEDDPADQYLLRRAAEKADINGDLQLVSNGEALLRFLRAGKSLDGDDGAEGAADLILLDLNMPVMDGRETMNNLRHDDALKHIPIIVLSTSDGQDDVRESYQLGASSYIVKPRSFDKLVDAMVRIENYWGELCELTDRNLI